MVDPELSPRLVPGGRSLYRYDFARPALKVFDLDAKQWRTFAPPPGVRMGDSAPSRPVWEDAEHLVLLVEYATPTSAVRVDIANGNLEALPLMPDPGYRPVLIEPFQMSTAP